MLWMSGIHLSAQRKLGSWAIRPVRPMVSNSINYQDVGGILRCAKAKPFTGFFAMP